MKVQHWSLCSGCRSGNPVFPLVVVTVIHQPEILSGLFTLRGSAPPNSASLRVFEDSEESESHIFLLAPGISRNGVHDENLFFKPASPVIKFSRTFSKNYRKMWLNGRRLEPWSPEVHTGQKKWQALYQKLDLGTFIYLSALIPHNHKNHLITHC